MANFVEFEYYNFDNELCKKVINIDHIALINYPKLFKNGRYNIIVWWGENGSIDLYLKTKEEAQDLYDKLRGKKADFWTLGL